MVANPVVDQVISAGLGELTICKCTLQITVKKILVTRKKNTRAWLRTTTIIKTHIDPCLL